MDQRVRGGGTLRRDFPGAARMRSGGGRRLGRVPDESPHIVVMALRLLVLYSILTSALWVFVTSN